MFQFERLISLRSVAQISVVIVFLNGCILLQRGLSDDNEEPILCTWPAKLTPGVFGEYDMSLCEPYSRFIASSLRDCRMVSELFNITFAKPTCINYKSLWSVDKKLWLFAKIPNIYHLYPMDVDLESTVRRIQSGLPIGDVSFASNKFCVRNMNFKFLFNKLHRMQCGI